MKSSEIANEVVNNFNNIEINGCKVRIAICRSKAERMKYKKKLRESAQFKNVYVKNFPADFTDE